MTEPIKELAQLDRLIHAPSRLAILTALMACKRADFTYLLNITGLTKGNLSANLNRLEGAGLVAIEKEIVGKVARTTARLTDGGQGAIAAYWERLERVKQGVINWQPQSA